MQQHSSHEKQETAHVIDAAPPGSPHQNQMQSSSQCNVTISCNGAKSSFLHALMQVVVVDQTIRRNAATPSVSLANTCVCTTASLNNVRQRTVL